MSGGDSGEEARCVYCGASEELEVDAEMEAVWYCRTCLKRRDDHQDLIDHGFDDEEPSNE